MGVQLFPHQEEALTKLKTGSILWGGVGSGKSITGIAYYWKNYWEPAERSEIPITNLIIITTARKRDTGEWEGELARFSMVVDSKIEQHCVSGKWHLRSTLNDQELRLKHKNGHLEHVAVDSWNNIHKYVDLDDEYFFMFDEQRVVGYGPWTESFLKITKKHPWILLSATPGDCWMDYLPVFIANGFYKNKTEFQRDHVRYNRYNTKYPQITGYMNTKLLEKHRDDILVGMSFERHTEPHHIYLTCEWDREAYDTVMKTRMNPYTREPIQQAGELCFVLRRIVNTDKRRMERFLEILYSHPKTIVFYNYDYELEIMKAAVGKAKWIFGEWNGHRHDPLPKGSRWVYLVQYTAGAEGWNCIETDTIVFFSQSYSYKAMVQAAGRIDRLNTAYHDLYYYYLTSNSKIDLAMRRALKQKRNFNESAFAGAAFR